MFKRKHILAAAVAAAALLAAFALPGCVGQGGSAGGSQSDGALSSESALVAYHEAVGFDITGLEEVSAATCGDKCHDGIEGIVESTEGYWEGIGQIGSGNPHASHTSSSYECTDCHAVDGEQVNRCNQCHDYESPEDWVDPDPTTTPYGKTATEPLY